MLVKLTAEEDLTLAESEWICGKLELIHKSEDGSTLNPHDYPLCEDALFRLRYMLYFNNINGWYKAFDWYGEIPPEKKAKDVALINRHYESWKHTIQITNHPEDLLQNISKETRHHFKEIHRYCKRQFIWGNRRDYLEKSIILHSKYIYYLTLEYYNENDLIEITIVEDETIKIDSFCFTHILFRHYSKIIKEYQVGKSYHEFGIDYKNIPKELLRIIQAYNALDNTNFDGQKIYFSLKGNLYAIWFRGIKRDVRGGETIKELRVQTLYPVEDTKEFERVSNQYPSIYVSGDFEFHMLK